MHIYAHGFFLHMTMSTDVICNFICSEQQEDTAVKSILGSFRLRKTGNTYMEKVHMSFCAVFIFSIKQFKNTFAKSVKKDLNEVLSGIFPYFHFQNV